MTRVYVDTSVISALLDDRLPDRQAATKEFWTRRHDNTIATSEVTRWEVEDTVDITLRRELSMLLAHISILAVGDEVELLATQYREQGFFSLRQINDARHVASAILSRQDVLLSWNFRHLVNRRRRAAINAYNLSVGLPTIEIISPPEL